MAWAFDATAVDDGSLESHLHLVASVIESRRLFPQYLEHILALAQARLKQGIELKISGAPSTK